MSHHQQPAASTTGPYLTTSRKKGRGMIEKKRRDKINMSLGELRRLVPAAFKFWGPAKLEKAKILQLIVDYLRMLHECGLADSLTNSVKLSSIRSVTPSAAPITSSILAAVHPSKSLAPPQTPPSRSSYYSSSSSSSASSAPVAAAAGFHQSQHHHLHTSALHSAATAAASACGGSSGSSGGTLFKGSKQQATASAATAAAHLHHQQYPCFHHHPQQQQQHIQTPTAGQDSWSAVDAHYQLHGFDYPHQNQPDLTQSPILDQFDHHHHHHQNSHMHYHQNSHQQQYAYPTTPASPAIFNSTNVI